MSAQHMETRSLLSGSGDGSEIKYLHIPNAESHLDVEQEAESRRRRDSSRFFNRIVGYGVTFTAVCAIIILVVLHYHPIHLNHHNDDQTCYLAPSCTNINHRYDANGWTNLTGWPATGCDLDVTDTGPYCCDICIPAPALESVPSPVLGDGLGFSYLLMDQIWLPQLCNALDGGHDPTVTHLKGSKCISSVLSSQPRLTIHGLWPNLFNAPTSVCCSDPQGNPYSPLIPSLVQQWPIYQQLKIDWIDPTTNSIYNGLSCSTCYMLNHEWQKHGTCFNAFYTTEDEVDLEVAYLTAGLGVHQSLRDRNAMIAKMAGTVVSTATIAGLYDRKVNVMCDPQAVYSSQISGLRKESFGVVAVAATEETTGVFLEIQTCWNMTSSAVAARNSAFQADFVMIDCPAPFGNTVTAPCPENAYISLFNDV